jgi:RNA polymerase-binding transcription factor DksA
MTETRIDELTQVLGARRRRLQRDLETKLREARANTSGEGESRGLDTAETSDADLQQDVGLALIEMSAEVLRRIDDAVARLASGTYGVLRRVWRRDLSDASRGAPICGAMSRLRGGVRDQRATIAPARTKTRRGVRLD